MLKRLGARIRSGITFSGFLVLAVGAGCKREKSDTPAPDPLTPPQQSAPAATELSPVTQQTDTPPAASTPPPPKDTKSGSGTGSGSGSKKEEKKEEKKEDEKKEEEKKEEDKSCASRCQNAFTTCMTPKMGSGGFPQPPDPEACRKSLEGCQNACK